MTTRFSRVAANSQLGSHGEDSGKGRHGNSQKVGGERGRKSLERARSRRDKTRRLSGLEGAGLTKERAGGDRVGAEEWGGAGDQEKTSF